MVSWFRRNKPEADTSRRLSTEDLAAAFPDSTQAAPSAPAPSTAVEPVAAPARDPVGPAPAGVGSKKLSNARLRASGLQLQWPDARSGYAALLAA